MLAWKATCGGPIIAALCAVAWLGCADETTTGEAKKDAGGSDTGAVDVIQMTARRTVQQVLEPAAWDKELKANPALDTLAKGMVSPLQAAGVIEDDDGGRLLWGEYAATALAAREKVSVVFKVCAGSAAGGNCVVGTATHNAQGAVLTGPGGAVLEHVDIGRAVLQKEAIKGQSDGYPTLLKAELKQKGLLDPAATAARFGEVSWGKRRLVIVSAYGPQVGVVASKTKAAALNSGRFDSVSELHFARRVDLDRLLATMTPLDSLVWLAAGVIETYKSGKAAKSVGMTVSRGVFGDEFYHRDYVGDVLAHPPLGGPGLVILAGSNTLYVESEGQSGVFASYLREFPYRPVVGFEGELETAEADAGAAALIAGLAAGDDLNTAMTAAGTASGAKAASLLDEDARKSWMLPVATAKLFDTPPTQGKLKLHMSINPPICVDISTVGSTCDAATFDKAAKAGKEVDSSLLTAKHATFACDPNFTGPFFKCTVKNGTLSADFQVHGVLEGTQVGDQIAVYATGTASDRVHGVALVGMGTIKIADEGGGTTKLLFDGPGLASTFTDDKGRCCIAKKPLLSSNTSEPSSLTF